ncbi:LacI family DNA-binding transcriptional regulator [Corynebacterium sp. TAE3-ERU12]|uniref:LacI family DNA-binding transcriptional regulator n=1 Tax=Corynebacterium sp. TAE3-ERU12 TaxID=2849491 RepID=UPI001C43F318|nr:LacI family DNA-binding transcriptional regulator [Corynebacterium sp. TAE3-ERU12]MBV7295891.1 LacI family DNA-binding transcriptional regulator [Corynebacterium sp. TAE3-ERU12]
MASIAAEVGVSRTTVSNAYNRPEQLSPKLREHILAVAHRQGYPGPDPMARHLRTRRAGAVGVLLTEELSFAFDDPASVEFLAGLAEECGVRESSLMIIPASSGAGKAGEDLIRGAAVDGMIVYSVADDDPFLDIVARRGLPTVICDQPTGRTHLPFVGIDDHAAIQPAVRRLTDLGHRRIGILSVRLSRTQHDGPVRPADLADAHHHVQRFRIEGALEALADAGITDVPIVGRHLNTRTANDEAAAELLGNNPDLTAVVCTTDTQALAVLRYASAHNIRVPEDLSVTGFDGIELALRAGLTTIIQPNREKGRAAGQVLFNESNQRVILPTELFPGATVAPARERP